MKMSRLAVRLFIAIALVATSARLLRAQERDTSRVANALPRDVALEVVSLFNATTAFRETDKVEIVGGRTISGDIAVLNGPVIIAGRVTGRVLAINSDVVLRAGARIDGDLVVVGGEVEGRDVAIIGGEIRIYHPSLRYTQSGDQLVAITDGDADEQWWHRWEHRGERNYNRLELASAGTYNRVEGLPVRVGPVLYRDQGWGHFKFDATAILRSASSFSGSTADVGHDVRGEMRIGRQYGVTLGAQLFDLVDPVEQWQLTNAEVGLATFLFHRDYRDYFERHGGRLHAALRATDNADLTLSYGDERWSSRATHDPFTLIPTNLTWRANPQVDNGRFHIANLTLRIDTRNDDFNPWAGWFLLADYERGTGNIDDLAPTSLGVRSQLPGGTSYQRGFVDVRRYNRLAPSSALNPRLVLGGWLSGDALPLERRLSIDGPGTIPGFDFRVPSVLDVGTCAIGGAPAGQPAQCERVSLAQLEFRNDIRLSYSDGDPSSRRTRFRADGAWVFFADAGRGWLVNAPGSPLNYKRSELPSLSSYRTDIGGGLDFDQFGVYLAKAISDPDQALNVFVRVRHRF